jgi:hypothetical protein
MIDMSCKRALELILDAEPAELSLAGDTPLVAHLNSCARCRTVAARLAAQTVAIARAVESVPEILAVPARPEPAPKRGAIPVYAGLAAAAVLAVVVLSAPTEDHSPQTTAHSAAEGAGVAPPVVAVTQAPTQAPTRRQRIERLTLGEPIRAVAVASQRFAAPSVDSVIARAARNADSSGVISVAPPAGMRATVLATSNPAVTVIWLQSADTTRNPR